MSAEDRKARIAARFGAAAERYDAHSPLQREAAARLARRVLAFDLPPACRVLEVGCGTGHLTRELRGRIGGEWTVSDIAPAMVTACVRNNPGVAGVVMDAEHPVVEAGRFDLVVSSLTAQWFADLPAALAALCGLLAPGGHLALATLGSGSFGEWRAAHAALGLRTATPAYPSAVELERAFPAFVRATVAEESIAAPLDDPLDFVRGLRAIGADVPAAGSAPLGAGQMRKVLRLLASDAPGGVGYHLLYAVAGRG